MSTPSLIVCASRSGRLWMWCPGCDDLHSVPFSTWDVDTTDLDRPMITPSILVHEVRKPDGSIYLPRCHSFVNGGNWNFLADCTHDLAGQAVPMVPLPLWFVEQDGEQS